MNDLHTAQSNSETSIDNNNFVNKRDENNSKNNKNETIENLMIIVTIFLVTICYLY